MSLPAVYNFPPAYANDGVQSFNIKLINAVGSTPLDLTGVNVKMQLMNGLNKPAFTFSSEQDDGDALLTILDGGIIVFPRINSWSINPMVYKYDLQVIDANGFIKTYLKGTWEIIKDITV